jgi:hypothetical protein
MSARRTILVLLAVALPGLQACDRPSPVTGPTDVTALSTSATTGSLTALATTTSPTPDHGSADQPITVGHVRVSIRKVSVGKVPLKNADGSITYADEPDLMIALAARALRLQTPPT